MKKRLLIALISVIAIILLFTGCDTGYNFTTTLDNLSEKDVEKLANNPNKIDKLENEYGVDIDAILEDYDITIEQSKALKEKSNNGKSDIKVHSNGNVDLVTDNGTYHITDHLVPKVEKPEKSFEQVKKEKLKDTVKVKKKNALYNFSIYPSEVLFTDVALGDTLESEVSITNDADIPQGYSIYVKLKSDYKSDTVDTIGYIVAPNFVINWITVEKSYITVNAHSTVNVPISLYIPLTSDIFAPQWEFQIEVINGFRNFDNEENISIQRWLIHMEGYPIQFSFDSI